MSGTNKPSKRLEAYTRMKIHKANGSDKIIVIQNLMNKASFELSNIDGNPCEDGANKWEQVKFKRCTKQKADTKPARRWEARIYTIEKVKGKMKYMH
jgi:hypothetical protein